MASFTFVVGLAVLFGLYSYGEAVMCYQCEDLEGGKCGKIFTAATTATKVNCSVSCKKSHGGIGAGGYAIVGYKRECGNSTTFTCRGGSVGSIQGSGGAFGEECYCNTDYCNGATSQFMNPGPLLLLAVISMVLNAVFCGNSLLC
ncbi:uncharacterized protein LOC106152214 [Lingula anatina]|uniref:Uncharacterized protein LOC106152214 n=1 Tax=Lingula anatina TaxID=7574 RepID=A0A1S3H4X1_LINAN|nr:uncharacterized protein LOC106152214 [Lingula anatina]|eukprot:XP_013381180.1 uncharacterized protein LOC106152214 [Lingula anatina]